MSLLALQRDFRRHLVDASGDIRAWVAAPAPGFAVYHNAYRAQLIDCLAETYPHTHAWLGGEAFLAAMRAHIERTPPSAWTLGAYGANFATTLRRHYPDDPEVAELADLEWHLARAFEAEDASSLPTAAIAAIDWDDAVVVFMPGVRRIEARSNAGAIWSALSRDEPPPAAAILPVPATTLIWRQAFNPCFRTIDAVEHDAMLLASGSTGFAGLCGSLIDRLGEAAGLTLAGQMLGQWFADGLIRRVVTTGEHDARAIPCTPAGSPP